MEYINDRPVVLTIAGFDPSSGAGLTADIKTFEMNETYGLGVCTAITIQTDHEFRKVHWVDIDQIKEQLSVLFDRFDIEIVKIGLVQSLDELEFIVRWLKKRNDQVKIIWDPIVRSSTDYLFHEYVDLKTVERILKLMYMVTPNAQEVVILSGNTSEEQGAKQLAEFCKVFFKAGHLSGDTCTDWLYSKGEETPFVAYRINDAAKHGSGCVLSSAIAANLAKGYDVKKSSELAKLYVTDFLTSNDSLLGYHAY